MLSISLCRLKTFDSVPVRRHIEPHIGPPGTHGLFLKTPRQRSIAEEIASLSDVHTRAGAGDQPASWAHAAFDTTAHPLDAHQCPGDPLCEGFPEFLMSYFPSAE